VETKEPGYEFLFFLPISYAICFVLVLSKANYRRFRIFHIVFSAVTFGRYVVLPFMIVVSNYYGGRSIIPPSQNSINKGLFLMMYELLAASMFIYIMEKRQRYISTKKNILIDNKKDIKLNMKRSNFIYLVFGLFFLCLGILNPIVFDTLNFLIPTSNPNDYNFNLLENLIIYGILIFKHLVFLLVIFSIYKRYQNKPKVKHLLFASCIALLNISIYFGTNRSDIIVSGIVSFIVLYSLFGKRIRTLITCMIIILVIIITGVSSFRQSTSISKGTSQLVDFTDTLQVYLGGPYNVSIALETKEMFPESKQLEVLFFDIFRPMIGVNILVKNLPIEYSNIYFNRRLWIGIDRRSQIIPMIGQGNLFFGSIFSPILTIVFIWLAYYLEKKVVNSKRLELYYFINLSYARLGFMMGQNTMNMINDLSMNLFLFLILYSINNLIQDGKSSKAIVNSANNRYKVHTVEK